MEKFKQKNGVKFRAYKGDAMTLLAFDVSQSLRKNLAGFSIFYSVKGKGAGSYLYNRMILPAEFLKNNPQIPKVGRNSTLYSPIQKMNWVHVPNTDVATRKAVFGEYTYEITPRYIEDGKLLDLDKELTVSLIMEVEPYDYRNVKIAFTRGFVSSVAYAQRFGISNNKVRPIKSKDSLLFDIKEKSGAAKRWNNSTRKYEMIDYSFEEQHEWLGWQARKTVLAFLDEAIKNKQISIKAFVYDLDEPEVCKRLLKLADQNQLKIIVDNAGSHADEDAHETLFANEFAKTKAGGSQLFRGKFGALAHSKVFIQMKAGKPYKVLTGSTNFSTNGIYINANHVLQFDYPQVAALYSDVFDASFGAQEMKDFKKTSFALNDHDFAKPKMTISFAPHDRTTASRIFDRISGRINAASSDLLFAIMSDRSKSGILDAVHNAVKDTKIFTYGITDSIGKSDADYKVYLYRPDATRGIRVAAKGIQNVLPPPFGRVPAVSGYAIHHKFVVVDFKGTDPVVYCGSSNLAYGPEQKNGDNLLEIFDEDVVTVFALEALRLVDHFHWRNYETMKTTPMNLDDMTRPAPWFTKWFATGNLYCRQRELYIRK